MTSRMPQQVDLGRLAETCIDSLYEFYQTHLELIANNELLRTDTANRYACGYPIPPFQREFCWSVEQEILFIESVWMAYPLSSYSVHETDWDNSDEAIPLRFSGWLIDGQQRLTTLERYWNDQIKINGLYWSELTRSEKHRFKQVKFTHYKVKLWDESKIKDLYNRMAFGGTAHTPDQIAV